MPTTDGNTSAELAAMRRDILLQAVGLASSPEGLADDWVTARDIQAVYEQWERDTAIAGAEGPPVQALSPQLTAAVKAGELQRAWVPRWRVYAYRRPPRT